MLLKIENKNVKGSFGLLDTWLLLFSLFLNGH